jgi:hypothetical protein
MATAVHQVLPTDFAAALADLHRRGDLRVRAACAEAVTAGWTQVSLAGAVGLTRSRIGQWIRGVAPGSPSPLDVPPPPAPPPRPVPPPVVRPEPSVVLSERYVAELRAMMEVARSVNGGTPVDDPKRAVSEQYTARLAELVAAGMTAYRLAQLLGCTTSAVNHRLGRHGYRTPAPSMEAQTYLRRDARTRSPRRPAPVATQRAPRRTCLAGLHPMEGRNVIVDGAGQRRCRECRNKTALASYYRRRGTVPRIDRVA